MSDTVPIIINASAGTGNAEDVRNNLSTIFSSLGMDTTVLLAQSGSEMVAAAQQAVREGQRMVIAGGGDGTLNAVATQLLGTDTALGVLPLGTLNHFARDLGISFDIAEAARVIAERNVVQVDVGEVNGRPFLNNSGLGLYPSMVRLREQQQERLGRSKWPAFFRAALTVLRRYPFLDIRLNVDDRQLRRRTPFVFIGNNEYHLEGLKPGGRARLDAAHLTLCVAHHTGRLGLLRLAAHTLFGKLGDAQDVDTLLAQEVWIESRRKRLRVSTDGEISIMETPLHYRILPGALKVVAPAQTASDA